MVRSSCGALSSVTRDPHPGEGLHHRVSTAPALTLRPAVYECVPDPLPPQPCQYLLFSFSFFFFLEITAILASVKWFPAVVLHTIFQGNRLLQNTRPEEHGAEGNPGYSLRRWC